MAERIRAFDWSATPLGPVQAWPERLKGAVDNMLASGFAGYVWWGPELIQLYNDAALAIVRARARLGAPAREAWAAGWAAPPSSPAAAPDAPRSARTCRSGRAARRRTGDRLLHLLLQRASRRVRRGGGPAGDGDRDDPESARGDGAARGARERRNGFRCSVGELQHRTRNLIGMVRVMADKAVRSSADLEDFSARFQDRLDALARVQDLLSRLNEGDRLTFDELIRCELTAMAPDPGRVTLKGPSGVRLGSSTVPDPGDGLA